MAPASSPQTVQPILAVSTSSSDVAAAPPIDLGSSAVSPELATLEAQVVLLEALLQRVDRLRQIPGAILVHSASVLRGAGTFSGLPLTLGGGLDSLGGLSESMSAKVAKGFEDIRETEKEVKTDAVQVALNAAKEREKESRGKGHPAPSLKRKRQAEPESPRVVPMRSEPPEEVKAEIPPEDPDRVGISIDGLPNYIRAYNKTSAMKLHIWAPRRSAVKASPVVMRITIADVLVAYVELGAEGDELAVENVTVFGPREKKPVHLQSDFVVFQRVTQHICGIVRRAGRVSVQRIVTVFEGYRELFLRRCGVCGRVLSESEQIPAVEVKFEGGHRTSYSRHSKCQG